MICLPLHGLRQIQIYKNLNPQINADNTKSYFLSAKNAKNAKTIFILFFLFSRLLRFLRTIQFLSVFICVYLCSSVDLYLQEYIPRHAGNGKALLRPAYWFPGSNHMAFS